MKKTILIILIIIVLAIFVRLILTFVQNTIRSKAMRKFIIPEVEVVDIEEKSVYKSYESPARVTSQYQVSVVARISGYLQKSYFEEGSYVKAGDTLFLIEPEEYKNNADVAKADVNKIQAELEFANKQLVRASELVKQDYIAKSRYDEIKSNRDALVAQLSAAKSDYRDKTRNLGYTEIKAPVDGKIGIIDVTVGNYVNPTTGTLTTIYSINPIYVTFSLTSSDYSEINTIDKNNTTDRKVQLFFTNGDKYEYIGRQDFVDNKIEENTGTVMFRATFQNPDNKLLHGEFVKVIIFANTPVKVPVVPMKAVMQNQEGKYVYLLNNKNIPQLKYIKTSGQSGDDYIIKEGLKAGDRVVVDGVKVVPNKPIKIK